MAFKIESVEELRKHYKNPIDRVIKKSQTKIDKHFQKFIDQCPFLVISSQDKHGNADVSPRGEGPGFVQVLDEKTLLIPDRPGNNRLDTLTNILDNPSVGLLFLIPGVTWVVRVNGKAEISIDPELKNRFIVDGKPALSVVKVTVEEAFFHCPKALIRSKLWDPGRHVDPSNLMSIAEIYRDQLKVEPPKKTLEERNAEFEKSLY